MTYQVNQSELYQTLVNNGFIQEFDNDSGESDPSILSTQERTIQQPTIQQPTSTLTTPLSAPRGISNGRSYKQALVPAGSIVGLILLVGALVGSCLLAAYGGNVSPILNQIGVAGEVIFGVGVGIGGIFTVHRAYKNHKNNSLLEGSFLEGAGSSPNLTAGTALIEDTQAPRNHNRVRLGNYTENPQRVAGENPEEWNQHLVRAPRRSAEGGEYVRGNEVLPPRQYYDLSRPVEGVRQQVFAPSLDLGNYGTWMQIPHFGEYQTGYKPDNAHEGYPDHLMAVRLPVSQLATFPEGIQQALENERSPELYFMVFNNLNEANTHFRNISMHAMALPNYNPQAPNEAQHGQHVLQTLSGGVGIETEMQIAMCSVNGIIAEEGEKALDTNLGKKVSISIHTRGPQDSSPMFSDNHAYFKIDEHADISSMHVVAKLPGKSVAFHAVILNKLEGTHGGEDLRLALEQPNLHHFLGTINGQNSRIDPTIKEKIKKTFSHPSTLVQQTQPQQPNHNPSGQNFFRRALNGILGANSTNTPQITDPTNTEYGPSSYISFNDLDQSTTNSTDVRPIIERID